MNNIFKEFQFYDWVGFFLVINIGTDIIIGILVGGIAGAILVIMGLAFLFILKEVGVKKKEIDR